MTVLEVLTLGGQYGGVAALIWVAQELRHMGRRLDNHENRIGKLEDA